MFIHTRVGPSNPQRHCFVLLNRKGLYPVKNFPYVLGHEASGTIVALPTDENVLNNERYKARGYKIGGRVAFVRIRLMIRSLKADSSSFLRQYGLATHAEYAANSWIRIFPVPDQISLDVAAGALLQGRSCRR